MFFIPWFFIFMLFIFYLRSSTNIFSIPSQITTSLLGDSRFSIHPPLLATFRLYALNQTQRPLFSNSAKAQSGAQSAHPKQYATHFDTPAYREEGGWAIEFQLFSLPSHRTFTGVKLIMKSSEYMQMR